MHNGSFRGLQEEALPNAVIQVRIYKRLYYWKDLNIFFEYQEDTKWTELHECSANGDDKRLENLLGTTSVDRTSKETKHGKVFSLLIIHEDPYKIHLCVKQN